MNCARIALLAAMLGILLGACGPGKVTIYKPSDLLTTKDVESYYGIPFGITDGGGHVFDELPPGVLYHNGLSYYLPNSQQMREFKRHVLLDLYQCADQKAAREHLERLLASVKQYNIAAEDIPRLGDHAYWGGDKLFVARRHIMFNIVIVDIYDESSLADKRTGAIALAKKLLERLK